jgi:hypothetical protein
MNFESWFETYRPVANPNGRAFGFDDTNYMFETYGSDLAEVERVRSADALIWTIVESESGDILIEGYHFVNRAGYFIASVRHTGERVEVPLSECC